MGKVILFFYFFIQMCFRIIWARFPKLFVEILDDITLNICTQFQKKLHHYNIESYHEHDVSLFSCLLSLLFSYSFCIFIVKLLFRVLDFCSYCLVWLPPPFYFLIVGLEERNLVWNVYIVSIHFNETLI